MLLPPGCGISWPAAFERAASSTAFGSAARIAQAGGWHVRRRTARRPARRPRRAPRSRPDRAPGQQLQRRGPLPGDDVRVIVGRHQRPARPLQHRRRGRLARLQGRRAVDHLGAVLQGRPPLQRRGAGGHHHVGGDPAQPRRQSQRPRVVPRAVRDHPARRYLRRQLHHRVASPPELERPALLQALTLEDAAPAPPADPASRTGRPASDGQTRRSAPPPPAHRQCRRASSWSKAARAPAAAAGGVGRAKQEEAEHPSPEGATRGLLHL